MGGTYVAPPFSVAVNSQYTNNLSPALNGAASDPTVGLTARVNGTYYALSNEGGAWSLPSGDIGPALAAGTYDVSLSGWNAGDQTAFDSTPNELTVDTTAPTVTITNPGPQAGAIGSLQIQFSKPITGFNLSDLQFTINGVSTPLGEATLTSTDGQNWTLGNLADVTTADGTYQLTLPAIGSGITDLAGNPLASGATMSFQVGATTSAHIGVTGAGQPIADGATTTSGSNDTAFGSTPLGGASLSETYTITNSGTAPLTVGTVSIGGTNASDFTVTSQPAGSVAVGGTTTFIVQFTPTAGGTRTATVSFAENDPTSTTPFTFAVSGVATTTAHIGVTGAGQPISDGASTTSGTNDTAFGSTPLNGASLSETYTITNSGTAPLTVGTVTIGGTNAGDFTVTSQPAGSVAVGGSTTFTVHFTPTAGGTRTATVSFAENDPTTTTPFTFAISGVATTTAHIGVTGNSQPISDGASTTSGTNDTAFGSTPLGGASLSETYTITNSGTAPLAVGTVTIGGTNAGDFTVTSQPAGSVAVGGNTTFTVQFTPTAGGTRTATVSFAENDPTASSPFTFAISGVATTTAHIGVTGGGQPISDGATTTSATNDTAFGSTSLGGPSLSETYTITNSGTAALTLGTVTIGGTNAGDFTVTSPPSGTVAVGGTTTFTVQFTPTSGGTRTATVSFAENDPTASSPFTFAISGVATTTAHIGVTGGGQAISDGATTTSATNDTAFGSTPLNGASLSETYTITNSGTAALTLGTVTIGGTNAGDFTVTSPPSGTVAVGGTTTFTVQFTPTAGGTRTATVSFAENDPTTTTPFTFAVSGVATTTAQIGVTGGGQAISDGATTTSATNDTAFGSTPLNGASLSETYTITNSGTAPLAVGTVSIGGTNAGDFTVTSQPSGSVAVGGTTTFTVQFTPTSGGTRTATVSFAENDPTASSPFTFAISGVATTTAHIGVTGGGQAISDGATTTSGTNDTAFGSTPLGGASLSETYTITNSGTAPLAVGTVSIGGTNAGDFTVTSQPAGSVAVGGNTTFTVQFTPTAGGTRTATVSFAENDPTASSPFTFAISGVATTTAHIGVTGSSQPISDGASTTSGSNDTAFGSTPLGGASLSETYTITNSGTAPLAVGTVSIGGSNASDFTVTSQPSGSVAVGGNTTFTVQFTPTAGGTRTATVSFAENDPTTTTPFTFAISGVATTTAHIGVTGAGQPIADGATTTSATNDTAFGSTPLGGASLSETYTITNSGTAPLAVGTVSIGGTNASDFTVTSQPSGSVAVGGTTTFTVHFTPTAGGTRTATVSFAENDPTTTTPFTFAISGVATTTAHIGVTGAGQAISDGASTTSGTNDTAFGSTPLGGASLSETYTITNSGTAPLTVGTVSIGGTNAGDFTVTSQPAGSVAVGGSTTFIVQFTPTAGGTRTATVSFAENDPTATTPFTFAISGVATTTAHIGVTGNSQPISDGATTTSATNDTAFGSTPLGGASLSETYTITNSGTAPLAVGTVTIGGTNASDFTVTSQPAGSVAVGGSTTFIVQFTPTAGGTRTATISFAENDPTTTTPFTFAISGVATTTAHIGVTGAGQPIADGATTTSATNDTAFGSTPLGGASLSETYTITNSGTAPLAVGTVSIGGTNAGDFTVTSQPAGSVAVGGTTTFTVQFSPTAGGTRTATVSFAENDPTTTTPFTFAISGVATTTAHIGVTGAGQPISDGATTTSGSNDTAFGSTPLGGASLSETYTITNSGTAPLAVGTVSIGGTNASDFTVTSQPAGSVAVGGTTTFTVQFTPTAGGTRSATVSFAENDPTTTTPFTFAISGVATTTAHIGVTGNSQPISDGATTTSGTNDTAFGSTPLGGASLSETYTITNSGTAPLAVGTVSIGGTNLGDFTVTSQPAGSVAVGGSTTFIVQFTPTAGGTRTATVSFAENDPTTTTPFTFAISGVATTTAHIGVTGNSQPISDGASTTSATNDTAFGSTPLGGASLSETYTITNSGTAPLAVGTVSIGGTNASDFTVTSQPSGSVAVGGNTTFTVQFTPTAGGTRTATISFAENDPTTTTPFTFAISGVATTTAHIGVTGNSQPISDGASTTSGTNDTAFGSTPLGGASLSETYTITNSGTAPLAVGTVSIGGTNASDFTVTSQPSGSVAVGGNTTFTVQFTPTAGGTRTATISFAENDPTTTTPFTFAISGVATTTAHIGVTGNSQPISDGASTTSGTNDTAFGSTPLGGASLSETYTITNSGTAPLTVGTVTIGGTNASDFTVTSQPAGSVAVGGNTTFTVQFTPTAGGTRTATVSFAENDPTTTTPFTFAISGVATTTAHIGVTGAGQPISDGATTTSATNDTAFGSTPLGGASLSETYTITNSGTAPLTVGTVTIGGTNAGDFTVTSQPAASVAVGGNTTFTVQFTPTAGGTRTATVSFAENDPTTTTPFTFAISGVATTTAHIGVTGNSQPISDGASTTSGTNDTAFGSTPLGGASLSETYTITNSGTAPLAVGTVSIGGTNAGDFTVTSQPSGSVAVGGTTTFTVQFTPTSGGTRTATVSFAENDPTASSPFTFAISGVATTTAHIGVTGGGQAISDGATTTSGTNDTAFGSTPLGGASLSETYTITNSGTAPLAVGTVSIGGTNAGDFTVTSQPAGSVAVGGSTTFTVHFTPTAGGTRTATVSFAENDPTTTTPFTFAVSGVATTTAHIGVTGAGQPIADGATTTSATNDTAFGSTPLNGASLSETYTITNSGTAPLTVGTVSIGGTNASDFTVTSQPAGSVAVGGNTTFTVQFTPTAGGTRTATVSFAENDPTASSPFTFAISGVATTTAHIGVTGSSQPISDGASTTSGSNDTAFGSTPLGGASLSETYTITNSGTAPLAVGTVSIGGSNASDFTVTSQPSGSVAVGGNTTFTVQFTPTAGGTRTATVSFAENDPTTTTPFTFAISGVATTTAHIGVTGAGQPIADGATTTSATNDTAFGSTPLGGASLSETYTITNSGTAPLAVGTVSIGGTNASDFTVTSQPSGSVAVGGTTTFTVHFTPTAGGTRTATVSFAENDPTTTTPFTFAISGVATTTAHIGVTGAGQAISDGASTTSGTNDTAFGSTPLGGASLSETYTITNSGTAPLTVGTVTIGGTNAGDFTVTSQPSGSVAVGGSTTFIVQFTPTAGGTPHGHGQLRRE